MSLEKYIACDDAATDSDGTFLGTSQAKACKTLENALLDGQQANVGEQIMSQSQGDTIQQAETEQLRLEVPVLGSWPSAKDRMASLRLMMVPRKRSWNRPR